MYANNMLIELVLFMAQVNQNLCTQHVQENTSVSWRMRALILQICESGK